MRAGLILLDKPPQISSHNALAPLKTALGTRIGHCGTLDPFASGLLIAVSGALTKIAAYFQGLPKTYHAEICFGSTTDTLDHEGQLVAQGGTLPDEQALCRAIDDMRGKQMQLPPQYSALKVNGERAYARARRGEASALAARPVEIYAFELERYRPPLATVTLTVSVGTYIRAVARDLALRCGSVAYLSALRRTRIGEIAATDACAPATFRADMLISPRRAANLNSRCRIFTVPARYRQRIAHGEPPANIEYFRPPHFSLADDQCALLFDETNGSVCTADVTTDSTSTHHATADRSEIASDNGRADSATTAAVHDEPLAICAYRDGQLRYLYVRPIDW